MRDAKGDWIMWVDCDDVVPPETLAAVKGAINEAPDHVVGLVVPVRFTDGTQVDHVKVFRNLPGVKWRFRIHEQILGPLQETGGHIGFINGVHVLHKNYDNSPEGQERKRKRDWKLLKLDLKENPKHPFVLFNCGMTAFHTGQHQKAIKWLRNSIQNSLHEDSTGE